MDLSLSATLCYLSPSPTTSPLVSRPLFLHVPNFKPKVSLRKRLLWPQNTLAIRALSSNHGVDDGFVLEDVPHLTNFLPDLPSYLNPLKTSQAYAIVKETFVNPEDVVAEEIVVRKNSPRGAHFRRAGPREKVYFKSEEVRACIVTCGGLCPGINTVIREIVCGLNYMYNVNDVLGIVGGYRGFYSKNTMQLTPKVVNDIHKRGGTILQTSRGGHNTSKIVDNIQDRGINQVYIIGGDGTQKGAAAIYKEVEKRGIQVAVAGIPKTIDNDISVIDKSFGFDTAVEEAQRAINAAHVEVESMENGVGIVKLMGRYSGFIAMFATLASRDVDCCLIPESPFYLEGQGGLFEFVEKRLKENGHMVIVLAEGAGQEYVAQDACTFDGRDASGNRLLLDVGPWLSQKIKVLIYSPDGRCLFKYQAYESGLGVKSVSWSPCGQYLAVGSYDQMLRVLNHLTWKVFAEFIHLSTVRSPCCAAVFKEVDEPLQLDMSDLCLNDDFRQGTSENPSEGRIQVRYDVIELPVTLPFQKPPADKPNPKQGVGLMSWSNDSQYICTRNDSMPTILWIWDMRHLELAAILVQKDPIRAAAWDPTCTRLVVCTGSPHLYMWTPSGAYCVNVPLQQFAVTDLKWNSDGSCLLLKDKESFCCAAVPALSESSDYSSDD